VQVFVAFLQGGAIVQKVHRICSVLGARVFDFSGATARDKLGQLDDALKVRRLLLRTDPRRTGWNRCAFCILTVWMRAGARTRAGIVAHRVASPADGGSSGLGQLAGGCGAGDGNLQHPQPLQVHGWWTDKW
jgi:hypothetical protein